MLSNKGLMFQLFIFILSVGYLVTAIALGQPILEGGLEPSFYPLLLGFFSVLFSSILLYREFALFKSDSSFAVNPIPGREKLAEKANYAPLWIMLAIFVYILAFTTAGYFISSVLFVFSIIIIFSSSQKIIQKSIISIVIVSLGYLVFEQMFGIRLPALWE